MGLFMRYRHIVSWMQIYCVIMKLFSLEFLNFIFPSNILSKTFIQHFKMILHLFYYGCKLNIKILLIHGSFHTVYSCISSRQEEQRTGRAKEGGA